jgi:large subunit ribosomal protein L25
MTAANKTIFHVTKRDELGKRVRFARRQGKLPANISGQGEVSSPILIDTKVIFKHLATEGESGLLYLTVGDSKKEVPVLIEEVQHSPVTGELIHISFRQVNLKEKVTAEVPVEVIGEINIPGAILVQVTDVLEVEALPTDLPEKFEIDVSRLSEVGQVVTPVDLQYDREKITLMLSEEELENPLVLVQEVSEEEVEEPVETAEAVVEGVQPTESQPDAESPSEAK